MKKIICILLFTAFWGCGSREAVVMREKLPEKKKNVPAEAVKTKQTGSGVMVGMLPFKSSVNTQSSRENTKRLFKSINVILSSDKKFKMIEQRKLEEILYEINSGYDGIADVSTAVQVGKLLGVSVIVCGRIGIIGENYLSMQIMDVKAGKTVGDAIKWDGDAAAFDKFVEKISRKIAASVKNKQ